MTVIGRPIICHLYSMATVRSSISQYENRMLQRPPYCVPANSTSENVTVLYMLCLSSV